MDKNREQRVCIKFCQRNGISCAETLKMLKKYSGNDTMSKKNVYKWYKEFSSGRDSAEDEYRSGRPATSLTEDNIKKVKEAVKGNKDATIRSIAKSTQLSIGSVQSIVKHEFALNCLSARVDSDAGPATVDLTIIDESQNENTEDLIIPLKSKIHPKRFKSEPGGPERKVLKT